ncbi:MAG: indole-3-glycerol phosphate synthase TrpC, partial [Chloroflexi bacterium]|nr:indole-3-glycerol phosphate synthase TrpC [Chloroflexota bacterium]
MILDEIVEYKRAQVAESVRRISPAEMCVRAAAAPPARDFASALDRDNVALIAEIKRASPSRGELNSQVVPAALARTYAAHGASAISVLTDDKYFRGTLEDLRVVRGAITLPVLRKDFIVDEYQVFESRAAGADAVLLIVRILSNTQLNGFLDLAQSLGMAALVETHDEAELDRALASNSRIVGINNRNLADFSVDLATTERLAPRIPRGCHVVVESGVFGRPEVERAARAGGSAVLVGEALMRAN